MGGVETQAHHCRRMGDGSVGVHNWRCGCGCGVVRCDVQVRCVVVVVVVLGCGGCGGGCGGGGADRSVDVASLSITHHSMHLTLWTRPPGPVPMHRAPKSLPLIQRTQREMHCHQQYQPCTCNCQDKVWWLWWLWCVWCVWCVVCVCVCVVCVVCVWCGLV